MPAGLFQNHPQGRAPGATMNTWIGSRSNTKLHHLVALTILSLVILGRWWLYLTSPTALGDEGIYLQAFRAASAEGEPNQVNGFYYPRTFALLGASVFGAVGEIGTRTLMRASSVAGLATTIWISVCMWAAPWNWRLILAAVFVSISPAVYFGIETGNISFAIIGTILLALALWSLLPVTSGLLLGGSTAIKPLAPLAILALMTHRPLPASRKSLIAGAVGTVLMMVILLSSPGYLATSSQAIDRLPFIRSFSLNRILSLMGLETSPLAIAVLLSVLVLLVARAKSMSRRTLLCFGGVAAVVAVPIIWSHTLLLTLPLQVEALDRAASRRRYSIPSSAGSIESAGAIWRRYEVIFVVLAVAVLQSTSGLGAVDDQGPVFQLAVLTIAYLSAPFLMAYVLATEPRRPQSPS